MTDGNRKDDERLRDSEIAIVDALKVITDVLVASGAVRSGVFELMFAQQRDGYIAKAMPNAAVIMEVLRGFAARPRKDERTEGGLRAELDKPPQGSA